MNVTITLQTVITIGAVITALAAIYKLLKMSMKYAEKPTKNEEEIALLRKHHDEDMRETKEEQAIMCYGILACLKGLAEQGCDGPVHDAIDKLEKHLNVKAHE